MYPHQFTASCSRHPTESVFDFVLFLERLMRSRWSVRCSDKYGCHRPPFAAPSLTRSPLSQYGRRPIAHRPPALGAHRARSHLALLQRPQEANGSSIARCHFWETTVHVASPGLCILLADAVSCSAILDFSTRFTDEPHTATTHPSS